MGKTATVRFMGMTSMLQSRFHQEPRLNKESHDDYELRTWRYKAHYSVNGVELCRPDDEGARVAIPSDAFKQALDTIASRLSEKTKGKATYTKHFRSGVVAGTPYALTALTVEDFEKPQSIFCSSTGKRGVGSRVMRYFLVLPKDWTVDVEFLIFDDVVTDDIFIRYCKEAGMLIGVGAFRRENGERGGTFTAELIEWNDTRVGGNKK
jgi:hypothetical protein